MPPRIISRAECLSILAALAAAPDDAALDITTTCIFFNGSIPMDRSTFYRGIAEGIYPAPKKISRQTSRWNLGECRRAKAALADKFPQAADRAAKRARTMVDARTRKREAGGRKRRAEHSPAAAE